MDLGTGAVVLLVAGGVVAAIAAVAFVARWVASFPDLPAAGPETSDLGPEPPAVANLLVNRCRVTTAAAAATLLDLAARRHLSLFEAAPGQIIVQVRHNTNDELTDYEGQVFDLVRSQADGGSAPLAAIELEQAKAERWRSDFAKDVLADARQRGLVRRRWNRLDAVVLGALAAGALVLLAAGLYFGHVETAPPDQSFQRHDWFIAAGFVWFALMPGLGALRSVRYSPAGDAAAARWLGVKHYLRGQKGFSDAPPAAVAIWDRLLAYGAAIGVARGALDGIPLEVEDPDVAWSRADGQWRQVRVEYPKRFGYGQRPLAVLTGGLLRLVFFGAIGFVFLPIVVDALWSVLSDAFEGPGPGSSLVWLVILFAAVFGAIGAYLVARIGDGLIRTYRGARDLRATETITGVVVKHHQIEGRDWFAVDPGGREEVKACYRFDGETPPPRDARVRVVRTPRLHYVVSVESV